MTHVPEPGGGEGRDASRPVRHGTLCPGFSEIEEVLKKVELTRIRRDIEDGEPIIEDNHDCDPVARPEAWR